ncbi:uncharacterized protein CDV56_100404, partial [Aspergillus thermomutatus]
KSKEKNITLEEARKRTEASLARKRVNAGLANSSGAGDAPQSPATSGAMDSLLEKLRAAAPQARDQRDRRRRARLKERHQVRIASGQKMPDVTASEPENGEKQADSNSATLVSSNNDASATETGLLSPPSQETDVDTHAKELQISESEDVADRAASMLQGLRDNMDNNGERARRRRESAEEERRKRRLRRRNGGNASKDSADGSILSTVPEPTTPPPNTEASAPNEPGMVSPSNEEDGASQPPQTPSIVVSPNADMHDRSPGDESSHDGSPPN